MSTSHTPRKRRKNKRKKKKKKDAVATDVEMYTPWEMLLCFDKNMR